MYWRQCQQRLQSFNPQHEKCLVEVNKVLLTCRMCLYSVYTGVYMIVSKIFEIISSILFNQESGETVSIMKAIPFIYGEEYRYDLCKHLKKVELYTIQQSNLPEGISVDLKQGVITGIPVKNTKHMTAFFVYFVNKIDKTHIILSFDVKASARDLWKVIEPDRNRPFPKTHSDRIGFDNELVKVIAASRRGRDHEHRGEFREDDFKVEFDDELQMLLVAVSDGMGSYERSREGSRIQCEESIRSLKESLRNGRTKSGDMLKHQILQGIKNHLQQGVPLEEIKPYVTQVMVNAAQASYRKLEEIAKQEGVPLKGGEKKNGKYEGFAATLLLSVIFRYEEQWCTCTFTMGDGLLVALDGSDVRLLMNPDKGEDINETLSLVHIKWTSPTIVEELKSRTFVHISSNMSHVLVMTDGVSNGKLQTGTEHLDPNDWNVLTTEILPFFGMQNMRVAAEKLEEWLHFYVQGTHDDRTLVMCELQTPNAQNHKQILEYKNSIIDSTQQDSPFELTSSMRTELQSVDKLIEEERSSKNDFNPVNKL